MDQRSQHKANYTESDRREVVNSLELTGTGKDFLNRRTSIVRTLRIATSRQYLMKLKGYFIIKDIIFLDKAASYRMGKDFLNTRQIEG